MVMLRGLPCRSAVLTKSSGAGSTAFSSYSSARGSWTGSATSSWTASFAASTRIKYAMQQLGYGATHECLGLDAFQNDTMQSGSKVQFVLA